MRRCNSINQTGGFSYLTAGYTTKRVLEIPFDDPQLVCAFAGIGVDDALAVDAVYSYIAGGVNDLMIVEENAYVCDLSLIWYRLQRLRAGGL